MAVPPVRRIMYPDSHERSSYAGTTPVAECIFKPLDLAGLRCPEVIQRIPEHRHDLIAGLASIADQTRDAALQHPHSLLFIFYFGI